MTIFIKKKFKLSDDQTNIDKYRFLSKLILPRITTPKFMMKGPLSHIKMCQLTEKNLLKIKFPSQRITAKGITPESLSSIGQF